MFKENEIFNYIVKYHLYLRSQNIEKLNNRKIMKIQYIRLYSNKNIPKRDPLLLKNKQAELAMASQGLKLGSYLKEFRIFLCQKSSSSAGIRYVS